MVKNKAFHGFALGTIFRLQYAYSECFAKIRKAMKIGFCELEIRCSIQLSYGYKKTHLKRDRTGVQNLLRL